MRCGRNGKLGRCESARRKKSSEKVGLDRTNCPIVGFGVSDVETFSVNYLFMRLINYSLH
jgi:hypothetical protein